MRILARGTSPISPSPLIWILAVVIRSFISAVLSSHSGFSS